jgi:molybdopterin-containing oxidoreductase family iron-sulfur binding subunit
MNDQSPERPSFDLTRLKALVKQGPKGPAPKFWRSLDELADSPEVRKFLDDEFPDRTPDWNEPSKRRTFLKVMGASLGLAGLTACTKQPTEYIVPYVREPEEFVLGKPLFFATAMEMGGYATGLLVESHEGRPTKIEGNPDHPGSLGAADYFNQASILTMYDPDRSQVVTYNGSISSWVNFEAALASIRAAMLTNGGSSFRVLTETVISPTVGAQMKALKTLMPNMKWHQFEPAAKVGSAAGANLAFGRPVHTIYDFTKADVIVSLDSDFLSCGPGNLRYAHDFSSRRHVRTNITKNPQPKENRQEGYQPGPAAPYRNQGSTHTEEDTSPPQNPPQVQAQGIPVDQVTQNRMYVVEAAPSSTGGMADHRYAMQSGQVLEFARQLAAAVGAGAGGAGGGAPSGGGAGAAAAFKDLPAIARDLKAHGGASIVIAGEFQPAEVHALAHAMNAALGNVGKTVIYTDPIEANPVDAMQSLRELVGDMNAGKVEALLILGGNPVYTAPSDIDFKTAISKVKWRAHLSLYQDETSELCNWHVPAAHYLESWGDTRGHDGTVSIIQPLIEPLYDGKTIAEILALFTQQPETSPYNIVKAYWASRYTGGDFEATWETWVHDGLIPNTAAVPMGAPPAPKAPAPQTAPTQGIEVNIRPDLKVWDGRWANNSWLQELPNPITTLTWDNAVWMSPGTGKRLNIADQDMVEVKYRGRTITGAALQVPGHADDSITVHLGYGRWRSGSVSDDLGINAYALQTSDAPGGGYGGEIRKVSGRHAFAAVQHTQNMEEREPIRIATLDEFKKDPAFVNAEEKPIPKWMTLYPDYKYEGYKWGMSIDLNACVGCGACVIACQSENNIPVVGKNEVARGRHMHWIRVDRYFKGNWDNPELYFQPVPCMNCENAPCELVCPVAATVHSAEGLNQMVYNRCVGTRYCSNNCPYKVRRFNFFLYADWYTQSLYPMRNPNVTVRSRGVMEKCTYCVQRIQAAKITAEKQNRRVMDGEIVPACAQTCPTRAIVFGDINDPKSEIAQLKAQVRTYSLLEELNTRPRTTYMGRLRNPNPEIERPA